VTLENSTGGSTLGTYVYDALGHRVQTVVGSANTELVFNPAGQRVSTWNGATGAQIQGQYYWGGKPVAFYKGGQTYFQHQDWEGTERLRTTYNGGVEGSFTSLPFGDGLTTASGSDNDAYHYGMLDHDYESDTEHAQFRQYNSAQGHWLSPDPYQGSYDPSNPQSFNRYGYAINNPLSAVDPSGLNPCVPGLTSTSQYCRTPNFGTGDAVATFINTFVSTGVGPSSFTYTNSQGIVITYNLGTDEDGNTAWIGSNGAVLQVNGLSADELGAPFVTTSLTFSQTPFTIATNSAPNNGPQTKQQLKQTCDAIYTNYTQQFAMQKLKNSFQNVAAFGIGMLFGGGNPWTGSGTGIASLVQEQQNNWNMDTINLQAALRLQNAGCFNQGIGY